MGDTSIEWTQRPGTRGRSWNPTQGCALISEGCRNCYAMRQARRFAGPGGWAEGLVNLKTGKWTGATKFADHKLSEPLCWREPSTVFVDSMSDLYYGRTNEQIAAVFGVMAACPQHTFIVLTKRGREMRAWFEWAIDGTARGGFYDATFLNHLTSKAGLRCEDHSKWRAHCEETESTTSPWPLPNVWIGVSVENQAAADERIPELLATPAAVRFLSCEPLLGNLYLTPYLAGIATRGTITADGSLRERPHPPLDWLIAGCESGPGARPCDVAWLRSLRDQCAAADVPYFLKQAQERHEPGDEKDGGVAIAVDAGSGRSVDPVSPAPAIPRWRAARRIPGGDEMSRPSKARVFHPPGQGPTVPPTFVALAPPDQRLARVPPGPDVLLTLRAQGEIDEWISGWASSAKLIADGIPLPGPLFLHGPPGTGKTAVTMMLARRLGGLREVWVIDAMRVTEGFLGATSANIAQASNAAVRAGAVLVLEEIDALASLRSYETSASVENTRATTSIMRVLELPGPIVLTSNRLDVIDPAVIRRCEYIVEMPEPTPDQRRAIVARELGEDPGPISLSLSIAIPLARRARRKASLGGGSARSVLAALALQLASVP